jgi:site-specific recombinase XerC
VPPKTFSTASVIFHDNRHTTATRIVRKTGNLRIAKELLRHEDISTTMKYAHVTNDDVMAAMQLAAEAAATHGPTNSPTEADSNKLKALPGNG